MGIKNVEKFCLDIVIKSKKFPELNGKIEQSERPDFIIGDIGIEHFLIDVITNNGKSINRMNNSKIKKATTFYNENRLELDKDIKNGEAKKRLKI